MEFQAVILAGSQGNALYPLCEDTPPYLLTIANRPLIHFQLELLHSAGFDDIIVVTRANMAKQVNSTIDQWKSHKSFTHKGGPTPVSSPTSNQSINVRVESMDHWGGTCAALRHIKDLLTNDFFVIQSDLVTNLELSHLADVHRSRQSACTVLMQDTRDQSVNQAATKKKSNDEDLDTHFVGIVSDPTINQQTGKSNLASLSARSTMTPSNRLVFYKSSLEMDDEECQVRKSLLRHCQRISMHTQFKDSHLYLFSHWVLSLVCDKTEIQSIQKDLVPYLVRHQFSNKLKEYQTSNKQAKSAMDMIMSYSHSSLIPTQSNDQSNPAGVVDSYSCYTLVAPATSYCKRANSVSQYKTINQELSDMHVTFNEDVDLPFMSLLAGENFAAAVGKAHPRAALQSSFVAASVSLSSDPLSLKKCIVGRNVKIGGGVKGNGSLLLENVVIEENVQLVDCVIAEGATIGKGSTLVGCKIGPKFVMPPGTEAKNETLAVERD